MSKTPTNDSGSVNIIGAGTSIIGDITTNGDIRIDGSLNGTLIVKGKLVLGPTGVIEGEIGCQNADISGTIKGKINVSELLSLKSTAKTNGDIITNKLSIEPGANFSGSCSMGGVIKDMKNSGAEIKQEKAAV
ncbi:MAG: polymer-forming cytoskeletal protein [Bacteroidota bacterium]